MDFVTVKELYREREKYLGREITVGGWLRSVRDSKTFGFLVLHDGTFFETLQIVYSDQLENFAQISKLNVLLHAMSPAEVTVTVPVPTSALSPQDRV